MYGAETVRIKLCKRNQGTLSGPESLSGLCDKEEIICTCQGIQPIAGSN